MRFSKRGATVKYNDSSNLDDELGSMDESDEGPKKKKNIEINLDYDASVDGHAIEGIFDHTIIEKNSILILTRPYW